MSLTDTINPLFEYQDLRATLLRGNKRTLQFGPRPTLPTVRGSPPVIVNPRFSPRPNDYVSQVQSLFAPPTTQTFIPPNKGQTTTTTTFIPPSKGQSTTTTTTLPPKINVFAGGPPLSAFISKPNGFGRPADYVDQVVATFSSPASGFITPLVGGFP